MPLTVKKFFPVQTVLVGPQEFHYKINISIAPDSHKQVKHQVNLINRDLKVQFQDLIRTYAIPTLGVV